MALSLSWRTCWTCWFCRSDCRHPSARRRRRACSVGTRCPYPILCAADNEDFPIRAADLAPVGDVALVDSADLLTSELFDAGVVDCLTDEHRLTVAADDVVDVVLVALLFADVEFCGYRSRGVPDVDEAVSDRLAAGP